MKNKLYLILAGCIAVHFSASANTNLPETSRESARTEQAVSERQSMKATAVEEVATAAPAASATDLPEKTEKKIRKKASKLEKILAKKARKSNPEIQPSQRSGVQTLLLVLAAILFPPLAVGLVDGIGGPFLLSIILTLLFYVPGLIYALWRVFRRQE